MGPTLEPLLSSLTSSSPVSFFDSKAISKYSSSSEEFWSGLSILCCTTVYNKYPRETIKEEIIYSLIVFLGYLLVYLQQVVTSGRNKLGDDHCPL